MDYAISVILLIIFIVFILIIKNKHKKQLLNLSNETVKQIAKEKIKELTKEYNKIEEYYKNERVRLEEEYKITTLNLQKLNDNINEIKRKGKEIAEQEVSEYKQQKYEEIKYRLETEEKEAKRKIDYEINEYKKVLEESNKEIEVQALKHQKELLDQLDILIDEIKDYEKKREVINKQILMEREAKEKADFYRIVVSDYDIEDLKLISQIEQNFHNKEVLNRAVFDTYIKKPMNEMIKRVLEGRSPSGIYMITNTLTNEIYIGRAVSIDKRWQEHCKSCFNLGTIAHSTLHTRMAKEGIWNFTFQILEEVPKEKLSEREKYWINFYHSKDYGMNERQGG